MAVKAASDDLTLNQLIQQNEFFIIKCAYSVTHHYITKSDDEWSIAIIAFTQAVKNYNLDKGSFLSFAELLMKRRLVDYFRTQIKHNVEISVNPTVFEIEPEEEDEDLAMKLAVAKQVSKENNDTIKLEIESANEMISTYGFSFFDLVDCSPKSSKTKSACAKAVAFIINNPLLLKEMHNIKQLPLKIIEKNINVNRKILERHRKYIIAAVEILSGDYPHLAEYMQYIKKEII
jgi:RNA polymerase sigma factor